MKKARIRPWTKKELFLRCLWDCCLILFRFSPRPAFLWRNWMLRLFGARIGKHVHVYPTTRIMIPWNLTVGNWSTIGAGAEIYNLGPITIGNKVTISQRAHLCAGTHDHNDPDLPMIKATIEVKDKAWICADAFVGPGVTICEGAVLGARAVAVKDIGAWCVAVGNPAVIKGHRRLEMDQADSINEK